MATLTFITERGRAAYGNVLNKVQMQDYNTRLSVVAKSLPLHGPIYWRLLGVKKIVHCSVMYFEAMQNVPRFLVMEVLTKTVPPCRPHIYVSNDTLYQ